jgi:hypothetical protein
MGTTIVQHQLLWNPGLDNSDQSLFEVYRGMPRGLSSAVPWYVRLLENPRSPFALPGAVDLFEHDCIHIVLGRGLLPQDEAFVLGFTMGASQECRRWHRDLFRLCARTLYRNPFRFSKTDMEVFEFAFEAAEHARIEALHLPDYRALFNQPIGDVRAALGLSPGTLRALYRIERTCWPATSASQRLGTA